MARANNELVRWENERNGSAFDRCPWDKEIIELCIWIISKSSVFFLLKLRRNFCIYVCRRVYGLMSIEQNGIYQIAWLEQTYMKLRRRQQQWKFNCVPTLVVYLSRTTQRIRMWMRLALYSHVTVVVGTIQVNGPCDSSSPYLISSRTDVMLIVLQRF